MIFDTLYLPPKNCLIWYIFCGIFWKKNKHYYPSVNFLVCTINSVFLLLPRWHEIPYRGSTMCLFWQFFILHEVKQKLHSPVILLTTILYHPRPDVACLVEIGLNGCYHSLIATPGYVHSGLLLWKTWNSKQKSLKTGVRYAKFKSQLWKTGD